MQELMKRKLPEEVMDKRGFFNINIFVQSNEYRHNNDI